MKFKGCGFLEMIPSSLIQHGFSNPPKALLVVTHFLAHWKFIHRSAMFLSMRSVMGVR